MAEIINLRAVRKARDKAADEARAAENRTRFGRSKAERQRAEADEHSAAKKIDGHRLERHSPVEPNEE